MLESKIKKQTEEIDKLNLELGGKQGSLHNDMLALEKIVQHMQVYYPKDISGNN